MDKKRSSSQQQCGEASSYLTMNISLLSTLGHIVSNPSLGQALCVFRVGALGFSDPLFSNDQFQSKIQKIGFQDTTQPIREFCCLFT